MTTLLGEHFSPWTEKARWALDHHGIAYTYREHVPLLGEPLLRWRAGLRAARASVPLLVTEDGTHGDSYDIARHAERTGRGASLFPASHEGVIAEWNARSEVALRAARALYLQRFSAHREAQIEAQPAFLPAPVRRATVGLTPLAVAFLRKKYGIDAEVRAAAEATLARELEAVRAALDGRPHLVASQLTYADIAMAVTLQFVSPPETRKLVLGPGTRAACVAPSLVRRFADLVAWRDALYAHHRG